MNTNKNYDLSARIISANSNYQKPQYLLQRDGKGFSPIGNTHLIIAPSKHGKTFFTTILMAAILKGEYLGITCTKPGAKVLYIDTEQDTCDTKRVFEKVNTMCGWPQDENNPRFKCINLRTDTPEDRRYLAELAITKIKPDAVFLDGSRDLLNDFNDISESMELVNDLMKWSTENNCALWHIQHLPPSSHIPRGHLGTESENKRCDSFELGKTGTYPNILYSAEHSTRHAEIGCIKFCLKEKTLDDGEKIVTPEEYNETSANAASKEKEQQELWAKLLKCFPQGGALTSGELKQRLISLNSASDRTADNWIKEAKQSNILEKASWGKYRLLAPNAEPIESELLTATHNQGHCPF